VDRRIDVHGKNYPPRFNALATLAIAAGVNAKHVDNIRLRQEELL